MHVYKLTNLCTCVCRSYTSGCRQNAEEKKTGGGKKRGKDKEDKDKERIRRGCGGRREKGKEKRSEEEEKTWIYLKTRLYTSQAHSETRLLQK